MKAFAVFVQQMGHHLQLDAYAVVTLGTRYAVSARTFRLQLQTVVARRAIDSYSLVNAFHGKTLVKIGEQSTLLTTRH